MTTEKKERRADLFLMLGIFAVGAVGLSQSLRLPPSRFDPLGPGSFPSAICGLLLLLSGIGLVQIFRNRSLGRAETSLLTGISEQNEFKQHPWLAASLYAGTAGYAVLLQFTGLDFLWATIVYLFSAGVLLSRNMLPRTLLISLAVAICASAALTYIFSRLLVVALP